MIKIHEGMADPIDSFLHVLLARSVVGKHLFHQLQLNQVFQIHTDLCPRKLRVLMQII